MDELSAFLDGPRAQRAFTLRAVMTSPWSIAVRDEAPLAVVVVTTGSAWLLPGRGDAVRLAAGDVALVRGPDPYVVADDPRTAPTVLVLPDQQCVSPTGESLSAAMSLGVNTWGNTPAGELGDATMLVGAYHGDGELGHRLLGSLPPVAVLRAGEWDDAVVALVAGELPNTGPARDTILDRLLDVLVICAVRAWFARPEVTAPSWLATRDPLVADALALMRADPAHPWTVDLLGRAIGLSRAAFARRFQVATGQAPMAYLASWRMALAADLLREPGASVTRVAEAVGYATPFAFSAAFKRHHGRSPRAYVGLGA